MTRALVQIIAAVLCSAAIVSGLLLLGSWRYEQQQRSIPTISTTENITPENFVGGVR